MAVKASDKITLVRVNDGTKFYIRYSANADGNPMTTTPQSATQYMGVASTTSTSAPTSYSSYTWSKIKGNDGTPGNDGKSQYLHIKYSNDAGVTFTDGLGRWRGELVDENPTASTTPADYTWLDLMVVMEDELDTLRQEVLSSTADIVQDGASVSIELNQVVKNLVDDLSKQLNEEIETRSQALRVNTDEDGNIVVELGSSVSPFTLEIKNNGLYIYQSGDLLQYFALSVAHSPIMESDSITIGNNKHINNNGKVRCVKAVSS